MSEIQTKREIERERERERERDRERNKNLCKKSICLCTIDLIVDVFIYSIY